MAKHIYIYSPASAVRDKAAFRRGVKRLKALGYEVEIDEAALTSHMRFAGDDATRLAAIGRAAASGADVALISRGGYGLTRILPELPVKALVRAIERGTQFVGQSDFTALQCALLAHTGEGSGVVSWAGPALGEDFGVEDTPDDIMEACFDDLLQGQGEGAGWELPRARRPRVATGEHGAIKSIAYNDHSVRTTGTFGIKKATLWGGNLTVLATLTGTPWMPPVKGGVLFVEDVNEHPYRVERMLTQLLHAGVLARQKAIVLGQFSRYQLVRGYDRGFDLPAVVAWLQSRLKVPIVTGLPFGHVPTKVLLPVGAMVSLTVDERDALIYWGD